MAKYKYFNTTTAGVRYREHPTRRYGKKLDRYFIIRYQRQGKTVTEGMGWASKEKVTQQKAAELLAEITSNIRNGTGPQSLKEKRDLEEERRQDEIRKKEAEAAAAERAEAENITFNKVWPKYLELAESTKTPRTVTTEKLAIEKWVLPTIGKKRMIDICTLDLERIKKKMLEDKRAPRTIEYLMAMIRQIFNFARDNNLYSGDNPARKVKKLKYDNKRQRFLTPEEAENLLKILKKKHVDLHDMALLSLHTGARAGEIFGLEWNDLDFGDDKISFRNTKNTETRHVFMSEAVKAMLGKRRKEADLREPKQLKAGSTYVFPGRHGQKIYDISRSFDKIITEDTNLNDGITDRRQKFTFHTLRHSAASWLAQNGTPLYVIQKLLGHKTAALTERYSHLAPGNLRAVTSVFDKYTPEQNDEDQEEAAETATSGKNKNGDEEIGLSHIAENK